MADTNTTTLPATLPTWNVSALAREHGVSRRTIARRLANGWAPPAPTPIAIEPEILPPIGPSKACAPPAHPPGRHMGAVLVMVAVAIAILAVIINAQTGYGFGTTPLAAVTFSGLSVAADALAIVLPSAAVLLWSSERPWLAVGAWGTWALAVTLAMLASVGFASLHISDTAAARAAVFTTATATTIQRTAAIDAAKSAAEAASAARAAECRKRGPLCRDLEHVEQTRMTELAAAIAAPVPIAASIADADPQLIGAVRLATWAGLRVTDTDVGNLRLALMGLLPNLAGLVLCFGVALRGRQ